VVIYYVWHFVLKGANLSGPSVCAQIYGWQRISDPPDHSTFNGGGGGGGGGSELVVFPSGPLITWHILVNSDPPRLFTTYRLPPPPPPPPSKPPNHLLIPPPHSDVTLHYLRPYVMLHYSADTSPSTHLSPVTSHPPVIHSLPSTSPPYTRYPLITLHLTPDMPIGQSMRSP
jgi:hypothetical protein